MIKHKGDFIQLVGTVAVLAIIIGLFAHVVMTPEYWERGQPPRTSTLLEKANEQFAATITKRGEFRTDIASRSSDLQKHLLSANEMISKNDINGAKVALEEARSILIGIESDLSIGSRAAYGELTGQLRVLISQISEGETVNSAPFALYAARVIRFLTRELEVGAPVRNLN